MCDLQTATAVSPKNSILLLVVFCFFLDKVLSHKLSPDPVSKTTRAPSRSLRDEITARLHCGPEHILGADQEQQRSGGKGLNPGGMECNTAGIMQSSVYQWNWNFRAPILGFLVSVQNTGVPNTLLPGKCVQVIHSPNPR